MTLHKLSAGDGYTYLTRQVASADELRPGGQSLADYYTARGNPPGVWLGGGAEVLGVAGTEVSEAQMRALFGAGLHPDAEAMLTAGMRDRSTRLGAAYPTYADLPPCADRVEARIAQFTQENNRPPSTVERNAMAAAEARRGRRAVAGYDLVFSPVKSVSVLWALGGSEVRAALEDAHHEAVRNTVGWIERHAAFTRIGHGGVAQVDTDGLVCAAFDHRESRAGDPDLHTHVAVANKVRGLDGRWRSLDARALYALGVAASERYNTRLEDAVARRLGVGFEERPGGTPGKRPVREIAGVPAELITHFSRRRALIEARLGELRRDYRTTHGREPGRSAQLQLAQQATLETREGKGTARTLAEQVAGWTDEARRVVGERRLSNLVWDCTSGSHHLDAAETVDVEQLARRVVRAVSEQRSTWSVWNVRAEAERQTRSIRPGDVEARERLVEAVVTAATGPAMSIRIAEPTLVREPDQLIRASDGQSVFVAHGSERFTTSEVLLAEDRLVDAGRTAGAPRLDELVLEAALAIAESRDGVRLDDGQRGLVKAFVLSANRLAVGIGPAGAGKTTAMRAVAHAWAADGGRVVALATSAKAAEVIGGELALRAENLHKFLFENSRPDASLDDWFRLRAGDLVLVDEAGMAGTLHLDRLLRLTTEAGASLRLLGDPAQLASVEAGGALRLLEREVGAAHLTEVHRFTDPDEAAATLALRRGDPKALAFYESHGRIRSGSHDTMLEAAYEGWSSDIRSGRTSVLIAAASHDVAALNLRARAERVALGDVEPVGVELRDGTVAGGGDWVVTRANARTLRIGRHGWVRNGDLWRVEQRHRNGSLGVRRLDGRAGVRLPADYVAASVELGYAATVHRVQGTTTDTAHALVTPELGREALYVASTRGRHRTTWYAATEEPVDLGCVLEPESPSSTRQMLTAVLARRHDQDSARETIRTALDTASSLGTLVPRYLHAWSMAAHDTLRLAAQPLTPGLRYELVNGLGASHLARVLATAAHRDGSDPGRLLAAAVALDDLDQTHAPALVVATRIEDHRDEPAGLPSAQAQRPMQRAKAPLPWLPPPDAGDPGWHPHLRERARLIGARAEELGSLAAAHVEQHGRDPNEGAVGPPAAHISQELAVTRTLADTRAAPHPSPRPYISSPRVERTGPRLTR